MKKIIYLFICCTVFSYNCSAERGSIDDFSEPIDLENDPSDNDTNVQGEYNVLALGDSYTIGQSVCQTCRFPVQLRDSLKQKLEPEVTIGLKIIAQTGWPTGSLINAIETDNTSSNYDLVTLLIGVNNEFQNRPFSVYESEFPELVNTAISKGKGDKTNVIVISIPDYAFTPFGKGNPEISARIDTYNYFAEKYCIDNNITFVNITDITRMGLDDPSLVASDGLHPSEQAYTKFVARILPFATEKLKN